MNNKRDYHYRAVDHNVFRAYDIRGIVDEELDEDAFYTIGKALSYQLKALGRRNMLIARDGRLSSERLLTALAEGLLSSGINLVDLGMVPTPVMYYATHVYGIDSGLIVTGSHNPANYNGIKMVLAGKTLVHADIKNLCDIIAAGHCLQGKGSVQKIDIGPEYSARVVHDSRLSRRLKVVVDCGNGVAGLFAPRVLESLGCEVVPLYCDVDGRFPNHHPDPSVESNLYDLRTAIEKHEADLGLAFDGDGDRLGVMTSSGRIIWPDRLLMLFAQHVLRDQPGATIAYDVKCSADLARIIEVAGGRPRMCPTGHSIVKAVMKEEHAILAGEMSGHIFFKDRWYGFDDALYSACRLLEIVSQTEETLDVQFARIPDSTSTPEIKIPISEEKKFTFMQRLSEQASFPEASCITIDGLRIEFNDGWGLIRASNTTPCLVARFEARDEDSLRKIQRLFKKELLLVDEELNVPF